jgi:PAS domain-containing protein
VPASSPRRRPALVHAPRLAPARSERQIEKWIGVCTDIDDARRAQEALRDSEEQFRSLADPLPKLAWMARGRLRQSVGLRVLG